MRIYAPATFPLLRSWVAAGEASPAGPAYAVTGSMREAYREGDDDELEQVARDGAARGALDLLAVDDAASRRRVVLVAEVPDASCRPVPDDPHGRVDVAGRVARRSWACALVDDPKADGVVATAVTSLPAAAAGDDDATWALDTAQAVELGWYAVQELDALVGGG